jgi:hypothetical protein
MSGVLAHGPAEQRSQSAPHPPRIGAGEVGAGDQRIRGERATLIRPQRLAVPFGVISVLPKLPVSERVRQP